MGVGWGHSTRRFDCRPSDTKAEHAQCLATIKRAPAAHLQRALAQLQPLQQRPLALQRRRPHLAIGGNRHCCFALGHSGGPAAGGDRTGVPEPLAQGTTATASTAADPAAPLWSVRGHPHRPTSLPVDGGGPEQGRGGAVAHAGLLHWLLRGCGCGALLEIILQGCDGTQLAQLGGCHWRTVACRGHAFRGPPAEPGCRSSPARAAAAPGL